MGKNGEQIYLCEAEAVKQQRDRPQENAHGHPKRQRGLC